MMDNNIHDKPTLGSNNQPVDTESIPNISKEISQTTTKPKRLWGWYIFVIMFGGYALFIMMPMVGIVYNSEMYSVGLYSVKQDLFEYIEKHQQFPPAEKWCDALLEEDYSSLQYDSDDKGNFPFILNKHIFLHIEPPENMVVAFFGGNEWGPETSGRNLVGDIDLAKKYNRVAVLFGNGDMRTFRSRQAPYLRWRFEDDGVIPESDVKLPFLMMSMVLTIVSLMILIACRDSLRMFWPISLVIGIISAGAGVFLGSMAELTFYKSMDMGTDYIVPWIGSIWGFVIGVCFWAILGKIYKKYHANVIISSYGIVLGPLTGIAASSIIHGYLMIAYEESYLGYMLAGSFFGIIAGGGLGLISSGLMSLYKNKLSIQNYK